MSRASDMFKGGGPVMGVPQPVWRAGTYLTPPGFSFYANGAMVANKIYYAPFYIDRPQTLSGMRMTNRTTTDSGDKLRLGIYRQSQTNGGPGALITDCGEITLTAAITERALTASIVIPAADWYWLAQAPNAAIDCYFYASGFGQSSNVGYQSSPIYQPMVGSLTRGTLTATPTNYPAIAMVADFTYGALPSTAPTTNLTSSDMPDMCLYK